MKELVYDDERWIRRLRSMGRWDEAEARRWFEENMKRKLDAERRTGMATNGHINGAGRGHQSKPSNTIFDAGVEEQKQRQSLEALKRARTASLDKGFGAISLQSPIGAPVDPAAALTIIQKTRSIRGNARQEYAKVYRVLGPYYFDLVTVSSHTDAQIFRDYINPEQQARMLQQLKTFSRSDFALGSLHRLQRLDSMTGLFENAVLREFEQGQRMGDIDGQMKLYARVLITLNGGASAVDTFIQNNELMTRKGTLGNPVDCLHGTAQGKIDLQPSHHFFEILATSLNDQVNIINRVFPETLDVMKPFLERVQEDIIAGYITTLLDEAHERNFESYVKATAGLFQQAMQFAQSLKPTKASAKTFPEDAATIVARSFEPHVDLYFQEERELFKRNSTYEVETWERRLADEEASQESLYMASFNRQAAKSDFMSSFRKVVMMPVTILPTMTFTSTKPAATNGDKLGASAPTSRSATPVPTERSASPQPDASSKELAAKTLLMNSRLEGIKSLFSIEVALDLVHNAKAGLERIAVFVKMGGQRGTEAKEQCELIFVLLLQVLGDRHIKVGFDKAVTHLSGYNPRDIKDHSQRGVEPLVTFLELVNVGDLIQQMIDVFYLQELVAAKLSDRDDFLSPAVKEKKRFEQMLDERVAAGLNKGIDVLMDEVEFICATTQQPIDFNPGAAGDGASVKFEIGQTATSKRVIDLVSSHTSMLVGSTEKTMLDVFNQEVGLRLFHALCKHIKRQRISVDGAFNLIR